MHNLAREATRVSDLFPSLRLYMAECGHLALLRKSGKLGYILAPVFWGGALPVDAPIFVAVLMTGSYTSLPGCVWSLLPAQGGLFFPAFHTTLGLGRYVELNTGIRAVGIIEGLIERMARVLFGITSHKKNPCPKEGAKS